MTTTNDDGITARNFISEFFDLWGLSPDLADWTEERMAGNPPRLIRLQRLIAMTRALGVPWGPTSFVEGRFIQPDDSRYASVFEKLAHDLPRGLRAEPGQLPQYLKILFDYRKRIDSALSFSDDVIEASGLFLHAHRQAGKLNQIIESNLAIVDGALAAVISPEAASFSADQLVRDFGFPDVDLAAVDKDWWQGPDRKPTAVLLWRQPRCLECQYAE
jgi:hypothetical protein